MTLETSKLITVVQGTHDVLIEICVGSRPSADQIRALIASDRKNISYQRGFLEGLEAALQCQGIPAFLSGEQSQRLVSRINQIGCSFNIAEKEGVTCQKVS